MCIAVAGTGDELLLEVILPESNTDKNETYYLDMLQHFYTLGIKPDWWKLPPLSAENWQQVGALIDANDPFCRGVLYPGAGLTGRNAEGRLRCGCRRTLGERFCRWPHHLRPTFTALVAG